MARAAFARRTKSDEIPLARRSSPKRLPRLKQVFWLVVFAIALIASVTAFLPRIPFFSRLSVVPPPELEAKNQAVSDGRLLGHFPYPEANGNDLVSVYPGLEIHKDTYASLKKMRAAATSQGIDLVLLSGFRSHELQRQIFFEIKSIRNQTASQRAEVSAPPGYSEHSTGYAIDLGDGSMRETDLSVEFESTRAFRWLLKNAAKYHFTLSFPKENPQGVSYEPWHWRFEGTAEALRQFENVRRYVQTR